MNWVYIDKDTYEVKYGVRANAQSNLTGPFDCTRQDRRLTFDGWEGWCAVEEFPTLWALYYDVDDNGLQSKVAPGTRVLEIELTRKEKRWKKEVDERQQDQTTKRAVETKEDAPVDNPVTDQPQLDPPGVYDVPPEPLPIPKSIFSDKQLPPEPLQPARPQTPPPAYSANLEAISSKALPKGTPSPPSAFQPSPLVAPLTKTPSPSNATTTRPSPPSEKRPTPKLNRNSGTRALAQAQMFEAMSQKSNNDTSFRNGKPTSRPPSNADSVSEYSDQGLQRTSADILQAYMGRPDSSILNTPLGAVTAPPTQQSTVQPTQILQPSAPVSDPAVFGGPSDRPTNLGNQRDKPFSKENTIKQGLRRKGSFSSSPSRAPKEPPPPLPPSGGRRPGSPRRGPTRTSTSPDSRRVVPRDRTRTNSPGSRRPPPIRSATGIERSNTTAASALRQRGDSTSSQNDDPARKPLTRTATAPTTGRKSMAATMSTGVKTSMARRMTPPDAPGMPKRERSNSSLYRAIDDLMKPNTGKARASPAGAASRDPGRSSRDDRPLPLRRAATSRAPLRDDDNRDGGKPPGVF